jgi:hypothetical protein
VKGEAFGQIREALGASTHTVLHTALLSWFAGTLTTEELSERIGEGEKLDDPALFDDAEELDFVGERGDNGAEPSPKGRI